jgi:AsmA protein
MSAERFRACFARKWLLCLLAPFALWALVLLITPTEWARNRLAARLGRLSGKRVQIGALHLSLLGGVRLANVTMAEPGAAVDPWLKVRGINLDLNLLQMIAGCCSPRRIEAVGVELRVHRRANGSFEFGDLLCPKPLRPSADSSDQSHGETKKRTVEFQVEEGRIIVVDEPSGTRLDFDQIDAHGSWEPGRTAIEALNGRLNGGEMQLAAQLVRSSGPPLYEGQVRCQAVPLNGSMGALAWLVPVLARTQSSVDGRLNLDIYLRAEGRTAEERRNSLVGRGNLVLEAVSVDGDRVIGDLTRALNLPSRASIGSIQSTFAIGEGKITSDPLTLQVGQIPITMAGWTDFDGHVDYRVAQEGLTRRLPQEARKVLAELPIDLDQLVGMRLQGTLGDLTISLDGPPDGTDPNGPRQTDERARLKQLGRRLRQRLLK